MHNSQRPVARQEGLVIQEMPDEILVFDMETNKAHCLNETAAFVWKACDGVNSVADITKLFGTQSGGAIEENLVWLAIDQLSGSNLLAEELKADFRGQTRREVIKKIGLAAIIALPVVSSLIAPTAALALACSGVTACNGSLTTNCNCSVNPVCAAGTPAPGATGTCNGSGSCVTTNCMAPPKGNFAPPSKGGKIGLR